MIPGSVTVEGTAAFADRYQDIRFNLLGKTNWHVSPAGFGCYRVSAGIQPHHDAMVRALMGGVNLIDTSTNYTDGGSEALVGQVLAQMIADGALAREMVVVVSKVGYLQGQNYALSQKRKQQGRPFPELVPYGRGLEHCIHPEFIEDQLHRSLNRLGMETLDLLLLHNPEYYLGWAVKQGHDPYEAREIFYQRIQQAFEHLEEEVARGRIQGYGISSNTFPVAVHDQEFVSLDRVWRIANTISRNHHFRVVQFPMNLYESGAVLEKNQGDRQSVLAAARGAQLGVLVNRPLNAFDGNRLIRLAEIEQIGRFSDDEVIQAITLLNKSESLLWRKLLPAMNLPLPLSNRIKDQAAVGHQLKHHWRNFGNYERWRQFKDGLLWPHMQGVFDFLEPRAGELDGMTQWLESHRKKLEKAVRAVGSLYVDAAYRDVDAMKQCVRSAAADWDVDADLSQLALRALRSTDGVHTVLVGMRQIRYVHDMLAEIKRPVPLADRVEAWKQLKGALSAL